MLDIGLFLGVLLSGSVFAAARFGRKFEEILPLTCMGIVLALFLFGAAGLLSAGVYSRLHGYVELASHAGGLRYHGMSAMLSELYDQKLMEARSVKQTEVFEAATLFARNEGILPAPESSHAIRVAIDEALRCKQEGKAETIVFGLTGTGYFDMVAYGKFNDGQMSDYIPTDADLAAGLATLPTV